MSNQRSSQNPISLIADFDGDIESLSHIEIGETLPLLPLRNVMLFPSVIIPVAIGRESSLKLIRAASKKGGLIAVSTQMDPMVEEPGLSDLYSIGTVAKVVKLLEMPDKSTTALLQGYSRINIVDIVKKRPYMTAKIEKNTEEESTENDAEFTVLIDTCKELTTKYIKISDKIREETMFAINNITNSTFLINFICTNLPLSIIDKHILLSANTIHSRAFELVRVLNKEMEYASLKENITNRTREDLDQQQKEYFLQQQIKNIQDELGGSQESQDIKELKEKADKKNMPEETRAIFEKELRKLERINPQSPDYNVQLNYLQVMVSLPWMDYTKDNLDINNAERVLNKDHYGLEKVKERILEHLAVLQLTGSFKKSPILCLYGPPGVGKTSLGKSIATALKRKYARVSLGGVHDEAEIRGHRRTYIGAMPGRIIKSLIKAGSGNPVFILDEIDKVTQANYNGDPSSALLEVLDPEQNNAFHDNFLDIDYDLSKILFIATANNLNTIPRPLLDRMELIEVSGYLTEEKMEIAKRHLIPREMENTGLSELGKKISFGKPALEKLIEQYTRESGVRNLEKQINNLFRKTVLESVKNGGTLPFDSLTIKPADIERFLGKPPFSRDKYQGNKYAGVVTGLAWTSVGGEILFIETSLSRGKGSKLTLTGNLGDVMKESAVLALEYIKAHASMLELNYKIFDSWNIHIHVPEGAVPKDGPSAGITIATSLASALTQRKVRPNVAMTGEITLRGKVLPVGGIKEKILAAKRAGITDIMMSRENQKNIEEISEKYLTGLTFHYVENVSDVFKFALLEEKVDNAIEITIEEEKEEKK